MKRLYEKYKDIIPYLFFGVCTTLVNIAVYWICVRVLGIGVMPGTIIAWILAVLFAYITNRKWVFYSKAKGINEVLRELAGFFGCRLATGMIDWLMMYIFVEKLSFSDLPIKILANIVVIILNYIASKLIVFRNRAHSGD